VNLANAKREFTIASIRARRAMGIVPRRRRIPRQLQPDPIRLEYYKALREILEQGRDAINRELLPQLPALLKEAAAVRADSARMDTTRRLSELIRGVARQAASSIGDNQLEELASRMGERTSAFQRVQLNRQVKAALGIDIFKADPNLRERVADFARENVSLIRTISTEYFAKVEQVTIRAARQGIRHEEVAKQIAERFEVTLSRAKLIARDQIGKLYGEINQARQQNLGIDGYKWRTSGDLRVREEHAEREGETYKWGELSSDEEPGQPINCRCFGEPDFSAVLASLK
jgi:SPP1 gp7 family putative phage head morphogenesis protein